jgi:Family of unknown function (DUF5681)
MSHKRRPKRKPPDDYEVGYCKPPRHTQFKTGTSGNPNGPPKKKPNVNSHEELRAMIWDVNLLPITSTINGKRQTMPFLKAMYLKLMSRAIEGHGPSMRMVHQIAESTMSDFEDQRIGLFEAGHDLMDSYKAQGEKPDPEVQSLIDEVLRRVNRSISGEKSD